MANKIHDGHRERMRERIRRSGLSALQEHEMLEYILYAFIPRKDTNEIAHALIDKFGSFAGVLNADENRLAEPLRQRVIEAVLVERRREAEGVRRISDDAVLAGNSQPFLQVHHILVGLSAGRTVAAFEAIRRRSGVTVRARMVAAAHGVPCAVAPLDLTLFHSMLSYQNGSSPASSSGISEKSPLGCW